MVVHVRYDGRSVDLPFHNLDLGDLSSDREVRTAVANRLNQPVRKFDHYTVDRNKRSGDITLRPQAIFG
jgi:hypothetical protein